MTFEELYCKLIEKHGNEFNWMEIGKTDNSFVSEFNKEASNRHPLYGKIKWAVAKCTSNDDVLFLTDDGKWEIIHLTYSSSNIDGFPKHIEFSELQAAMDYIEKQFVAEFF